MDIQDYMTEDHWEVNEKMRSLVSQEKPPGEADILYLRGRIGRHIFIEETILFKELPKERRGC